MRAAAMSVWIFINLVCFGMCGYIYLIWSQYWMYMEKQRHFTKPIIKPDVEPPPNDASYPDSFGSERYVQNFSPDANESTATAAARKSPRSVAGVNKPVGSVQSSGGIVRKTNGRPRFPNIHKPVLEFDSDRFTCDELTIEECSGRASEFKDLLLKEFHRVLMDESNVFKSGVDSQNPYNVQYNVSRFGPYREKSREELLCELKKIPVRTITAHDEPFASRGFSRIKEDDSLLLHGKFDKCMVVTSAGALRGSGLGPFIDSHDMVLRFNNAPTDNFTEDVGSKTTFRVLNSQVVSKKEFGFLSDALYRAASVLAWDPSNYTASLHQWYRHPDFPLFTVYKRFLSAQPDADAHLLHPAALWALWDFLQSNSPYRLRKNPPSSGFIGVWFSLWRCARVRVAEFVPSARATRRCHYHSPAVDAGCTLGAWHPLAQEKTIAERLRDNSDLEVFHKGYVDIPGLATVTC